MRVAVIDGQGGGVGKALVERIKAAYGKKLEVLALGTNSLATSQMLKAGADLAATGENAVVVNVPLVDCILGPIGIISANSMLGELTPLMATAISDSGARKILIPTNRSSIRVAGTVDKPLPAYLDDAMELLAGLIPVQSDEAEAKR